MHIEKSTIYGFADKNRAGKHAKHPAIPWDRDNNRGKMQAASGLHFYVKNRKMVPKNRPSMV